MLFLGIWFLMILVVSVLPVSGPQSDLPIDKLAHFVMYGLTSIFLFRYLASKKTGRGVFYKAVFLAALYGAAMEVVQHFLPYRSFSFGDIAANTIGAFSGSVFYRKVRDET